MISPTLGENKSRRLPPLRMLVTLIVVLPIIVTAVALLCITILTSSAISEQLGSELITDATARVSSEVRHYIDHAVRLSDLYARRLETKQISATDLKTFEPAMFDDLAATPDAASICFGNQKGFAVYLQRAHGRLELGYSDGAKDCAAVEWKALPDGTADREHPLRTYRYDPRSRPWYISAVKYDAPAWTPVYFWFGETGGAAETGCGYTRPIYIDENFAGVLTIDVTLGAVSEFLRHQPFASRGSIFIVDDTGHLVAASQGAVTSDDGKRLTLKQSDSAAARAVANAWPAATTSIAITSREQPGQFAGQRVQVESAGPCRANLSAFNPYPGAHWRIVTVLPESEFLGQSRAMQRRATFLALAAVVGAVVIGLLFARRLSQPLLKLTSHVAKIGSGDFDARLELGGAQELAKLADATNRMAAGLRQRMELEKSVELATHVQQSLLPDRTPTVTGLDIHGHSRYCDATGGDYLDFVDVADLGHQRIFIAVGDVTGHGLGAALLMAAARAAVRTSAAVGGETLGHLMGRVNDVLTRDARHGLFMTMLIMIVDANEGSVQWASAGHDAAIAYDPETDTFHELEGADLILGAAEGSPYESFSWTGLKPGSILFVGTDGVWEAFNPAGEMFGKERLRDVIRKNAGRQSHDVARQLESEIEQFVGSKKIADDITYVVIKAEREKDANADQIANGNHRSGEQAEADR